MSVRKFCLLLNEAKVGKDDKKWFPPWIRGRNKGGRNKGTLYFCE